MKRPWTALSPCPIAKELIPVHPRKVFFFLTTQARGELPSNSDDIIIPAIPLLKRLTPSISDPSVEDEEAMERNDRMRFSPSPEIELFSPELETTTSIPAPPDSPFSSQASLHREPVIQPRARPSHRAPSPSLEADERGFTETASAVRANRLMQQTSQLQISSVDLVDEPKPKTDHEAGIELFGRSHGSLAVPDNMINKHMMSSPMIAPKHNLHLQILDIDMDTDEATWNIKSPEHTSFDELDEMFDDY